MGAPSYAQTKPIPLHDPAEFDLALTLDQRVRVRWTYHGHAYDAIGTIKRLNPKMVSVVLMTDVESPRASQMTEEALGALSEFFPAGTVIKVARCGWNRWGRNHCVVPFFKRNPHEE